MTELQFRLLGQPQISQAGIPIANLGTAKVEALLYFLVVTGRAHARETLAELLWGDMPDTKAKRNLSKALSILRKVVGTAHLKIDRQSAAFNQEEPYWLDVVVFQKAVEKDETDPRALGEAVALYRGDFLEGLAVKDSLSFEEWVFHQREHLRELMLRALETLASYYTDHNQYETGLDYANHLLTLDPWRESAHRQMMILLAQSGQRTAALTQYETCRRTLAEAFGVEPMAETTALYERLKVAKDPPSHNLPVPSNSFVGRETELNQMAGLLDRPACRLLTIMGPGGAGKTRLALQGATRYLNPDRMVESPGFPAGLYFVPLTPIEDADPESSPRSDQMVTRLVLSIANALGFSLQSSLDAAAQLLHHLRSEKPQALLILDGFEPLIEGAVFLDRLLQNIPKLKLLVTSRERLNLMQEWVLELDGLDYPQEDWKLIPPLSAALQNYSAVTLFRQQAQKVQPNFVLSETEGPQVARICRLVEGMPLALELAASWLRFSDCAEIAAEIEKNLDFLTTSYRDVSPQHRSLRAVFEHSWRLLSVEEQAVFRRLSVFRGGFQPEAARKVAGASLIGLGELVDKSLVRRTDSGRYEIHELLRQYAAEKLEAEAAEYEAVRDRHAHYYADFLKQRSKSPQLSHPPDALAALSAEADNIRWGWQRIIETGRLEAVTDYWYLGGFEQADQTALRPPDPSWDRGLALHTQGFAAYQQGKYEEAGRRLQESLAISQALADTLYAARSSIVLGLVAYARGQYTEARGLFEQSLTDLQTVGEYRYQSYALAYLGRIAFVSGRPFPEHIEKSLRDSLLISRQVGDAHTVAHTLKNLGELRRLIGDTAEVHRETKALLEECVTLCREIGDSWSLAIALNELGQVALMLGDDCAAENYFQEALQLATSCQFTPLTLEILVELARFLFQQEPASPARQKKFCRVLMLVLDHTAAPHQTQDRAARLLAELEESGVPLETLTTTGEQKLGMSLETVVQEITAELGKTSRSS